MGKPRSRTGLRYKHIVLWLLPLGAWEPEGVLRAGAVGAARLFLFHSALLPSFIYFK